MAEHDAPPWASPAPATGLGGRRRGEPNATYDRIKSAIVDGSLEPGAPLVEVQVAKWCGVSRTPVREALSRLEQEGLVARTDRGLAVKDRSPEEILDIYEARIVLEALAARLAAERRTQLDQVRLEKLLNEAPQSSDEIVTYNRNFHRALWTASHNQALIELLERLVSHLVRYPATTLNYPGRWQEVLDFHVELVQAIVARDADRAAELATIHFRRARDIRLKLYEQEIF